MTGFLLINMKSAADELGTAYLDNRLKLSYNVYGRN